jgi:3-deoxy-manno-octulosonate cytidylyltransferase (CMP-KDO synthetase)
VSLPLSKLEDERKLEQMRALENGMRIAVVRVDTVPLGVDTPADLEVARRMLKAHHATV